MFRKSKEKDLKPPFLIKLLRYLGQLNEHIFTPEVNKETKILLAN